MTLVSTNSCEGEGIVALPFSMKFRLLGALLDMPIHRTTFGSSQADISTRVDGQRRWPEPEDLALAPMKLCPNVRDLVYAMMHNLHYHLKQGKRLFVQPQLPKKKTKVTSYLPFLGPKGSIRGNGDDDAPSSM